MKYAQFINIELLKAIGWTIIHSLWQAFIVLLVLKLLLTTLKIRNANLRYIIGVFALLAVIAVSCLTFTNQYNNSTDITSNIFQAQHENINKVLRPSVIPIKPQIYEVPDSDNFILNMLNMISPYLTIAWLLGLIFYSIRIVKEGLQLNRLGNIKSNINTGIQNIFERLKNKMGISGGLSLIITDKVSFPFTFGHFKPVILLPVEYILQVPGDEVEMILAHELAHIKRRDYLVNVFQSAFETIYFFNPFFQMVANIVRDEREYCCDDIAAKVSGDNEQMAFALTKLNWLVHKRALSLSASPFKSTFKHRIFRLIYPARSATYAPQKTFFSLLLLVLFVGILTNCVKNKKDKFDLPSSGDLIEQLYTDNQANHKVQVFGFKKSNTPHDLLLISTIEGSPLYAYLDGHFVNERQLKDLHVIINQRRTISTESLMNMPKSSRGIRSIRAAKLNHELDSINAEIKLINTGKEPGKLLLLILKI